MMHHVLVAGMLLLAACTGVERASTTTDAANLADVGSTTTVPAVAVPEGPLPPAATAAVDNVLEDVLSTDWDVGSVDALAKAGDIRTAWLIADLLRFYQVGEEAEALTAAFVELTDIEADPNGVAFVWTTNHLISIDLPAWDGYPAAKQQIFGPLEATWDRFFEEDHRMDWRLVTWGGVAPDTRPLDDNGDCQCIPALDHPETTDASAGDWYEDDRVVFGVVLGDDAIALPKHQMEVHEMVHVTLDGRELGIPYCTLCGSAQAYYVDDVPGIDRAVLRTSGLLKRSNKLMYDLTTGSAIDTFTGEALTGPLTDGEVTLEQVSVVASTWGNWKEAHPDTRIVAEDGGVGRTYVDDPLQGRDAAGPIFPVGDVDPRLPTQGKVVGVIAPDGTPIAFPVAETRAALSDGPFEFEGLTVRLDDSIRVFDSEGTEVVSHEAYWFAWSQFHEGTLLWEPDG